nr:HTH domain-containing protein [Candidatus Gracilibacteria bacterium]
MKTTTKNDIVEYIRANAPVSINMIKEKFNLSNQIIHRHIKSLIEQGSIYKVGTPPKVFYFAFSNEIISFTNGQLVTDNSFLDENFVFFGPDGSLKYGKDGFIFWCQRHNLDYTKEYEIYKHTIKKYLEYKDKNGFIDGLTKMKATFGEVYLDKVFYLDFYSIEKYGKTMLGNLMLYAKQTGSKELAMKILEKIKEPIYKLIEIEGIDSYAFIPPSIDRKVQLMDLLKKGLGLPFKELKLMKIFKNTPVPQKSLSKAEDRVINARDTIYVKDRDFLSDTILLIDDAVGSGATLNETAKKIKEQKIAKHVIGLAIVGSFKGFEVISEV